MAVSAPFIVGTCLPTSFKNVHILCFSNEKLILFIFESRYN